MRYEITILLLENEIMSHETKLKVLTKKIEASPNDPNASLYEKMCVNISEWIKEFRAAIITLSASCLIFFLSCQEPHRTPMHDVKPKGKIDTVKIKL